MINAAIHSPDHRQLWATPGWLPQEIGIIVVNGQFYCYEGQDLKLHVQRGVYDIMVYELVGVVADINSGENQKSHLVSMINGKSGPDTRIDIEKLTICSRNLEQGAHQHSKLAYVQRLFGQASKSGRSTSVRRQLEAAVSLDISSKSWIECH